jgi:hypothetical protein
MTCLCYQEDLQIVKYFIEHEDDYFILNNANETAIEMLNLNQIFEDF